MASHHPRKKNGQLIATKQLSVNATGGSNVISRWIDWCAQNRFLVFMGTVLLVLTGIWALRHIPSTRYRTFLM